MKLALFALTLIAITSSAHAQYGGPPMWDRGPNPEYRRERPLPPPRRYGPQMEPCIYAGECRGPWERRPEYRMPRYPNRYYDMY